jgi:hypothetical protein
MMPPAGSLPGDPGIDFSLSPSVSRGNVFVLTEDLSLVLALRQSLLEIRYDLTWTNNFWIGLSYLHNGAYRALVLDLGVRSVEERFISHFTEEYGRNSRGNKVLSAPCPIPAHLRRLAEARGYVVLDNGPSAAAVVKALGLASLDGPESHSRNTLAPDCQGGCVLGSPAGHESPSRPRGEPQPLRH